MYATELWTIAFNRLVAIRKYCLVKITSISTISKARTWYDTNIIKQVFKNWNTRLVTSCTEKEVPVSSVVKIVPIGRQVHAANWI